MIDWNAFIEAIPERAMLIADADGRVAYAGPRLGEWFGFPSKTLEGRPLAECEALFGASFAEPTSFHEVLGHPVEDRTETYVRDVEVLRPSRKILEAASVPVHRGGAFLGRGWFFRDVTREREITELKIEYGGAQSAQKITAEFLTVASHQLRTPMTAARWNLELLTSGEGGRLPKKAEEILAEAYKSVTDGLAIADDIMLTVEIEQRTLRLDRERIDLADLLKSVAGEFRAQAAAKQVELEFRVAGPHPDPILGDADKLRRAFSRLIDNAVRYTLAPGTVTVRVVSEPPWIRVSIADRGIGIPENEHARVFQRFYRSHRAVELHPDASGLGLHVAKSLIEAHQGSLAFTSKEGEGTVFTASLPAAEGGR